MFYFTEARLIGNSLCIYVTQALISPRFICAYEPLCREKDVMGHFYVKDLKQSVIEDT